MCYNYHVLQLKKDAKMFVGRENELESLPGWESILGLQFENLVVYEGELAPVVRGNGYFDAIISAADLLGA